MAQQLFRMTTGIALALACLPAPAAEPPSGYVQVAQEYGLPPAALYAVALTESGRRLASRKLRPWPWTLNVAGEPHYYTTRMEAFRALKGYLAQGLRRIDVGLMQVNWQSHEARLHDPWTALDPYYNLRLGAWLLATEARARGDLHDAIGRYHAPRDPARAARYRERVVRWLRRLTASGAQAARESG
jgi:soluble lytic murein transglycosylase-like protein